MTLVTLCDISYQLVHHKKHVVIPLNTKMAITTATDVVSKQREK